MVLKAKTLDLDRTYTNAEFEALPKFDGRYELIEGKPIKKMPTGNEHTRLAKRIQRRLTFFDPEEKLGEMLVEPSYDLAPGFMPEPDLAFTVAARVPPTTKGVSKVAPDLVIEILAPHDLESKNRLAEAHQKIRKYQGFKDIKTIWVIYPNNRTVEVYHSGQAEPIKTLAINDELDGENLIKDFRLPLRELFD